MKTTYNRVAAMNPTQRGALVEQFDKAARISGAEPIAVVGIGCRLPGDVHGPDDFWKLLTEGRDAIDSVVKVVTINGTSDGDWIISLDDLEKLGEGLNIVIRRLGALDPGLAKPELGVDHIK